MRRRSKAQAWTLTVAKVLAVVLLCGPCEPRKRTRRHRRLLSGPTPAQEADAALALFRQAMPLCSAKRLEEGWSVLQRAVALQPQSSLFLRVAAQVKTDLARLPEAAALLQRVLDLEPSDFQSAQSLGTIEGLRGNYLQSVALLQRVALPPPATVGASAPPPSDELRSVAAQDLGVTLSKLGRRGEAKAMMRHAMDLQPNVFGPQHTLATLLADMGQTAEAIGLWHAGLARMPLADHPVAAIEQLGQALQGVGRVEEAVSWARRAHAMEPSNAKYLQRLAKALAESPAADPSEATHALEAAHRLNATNLDVLQTLLRRYANARQTATGQCEGDDAGGPNEVMQGHQKQTCSPPHERQMKQRAVEISAALGPWHLPGVGLHRVAPTHYEEGIPVVDHEACSSNASRCVRRTLVADPLPVFLVPGLLSHAECEEVIAAASTKMMPSATENMAGGAIRTSFSAAMSVHEVPVGLYERLGNVTGLGAEYVADNLEFQVVRYEAGQHYGAHYDNEYWADVVPGASQRLLTVFAYMSEVAEGGETMFPKLGAQQRGDHEGCSGFKVDPRPGYAVMWYNFDRAGRLEPAALHGGCRVIRGVKWAANLWVLDTGRRYEDGGASSATTAPHSNGSAIPAAAYT